MTPRRSAFSFETLDIHLQPAMRETFFAGDSSPALFDRALANRLADIQRRFDEQAQRSHLHAAA